MSLSPPIADWPVALLAGGLGTRLGTLTRDLPKALVPVNGRPFLAHQFELLQRQGLRHVVLCVAHQADAIRQFAGDGSAFGLRVEYSADGPRLLGTGGALRRALPLLPRPFFVLYGDSYLPTDFRAVAAAYTRCGRPALMTVFANAGRWDTSNVCFEHGRLVRYDKHHRDPAMRHIDYGLSVLQPDLFRNVPADEPVDLAALYSQWVAAGSLAGHEVAERFYEIGSPAGLAELEQHLRTVPSP